MPIGTDGVSRDIVIPQFYMDAIERPGKGGGPAEFDNVEMVRIIIPGQRDEMVRPVEPRDADRWPLQYDRFKKGQEAMVDGTPIKEFSSVTDADRKQLLSAGFQTVEQVAGCGDDIAARMHLINTKRKAQEFLSARADLGNVAQLKNRITELEKEVKRLNENAPPVVSGRAEGDGVQPADSDSVPSGTGQQAIGAARKRGRPRANNPEQVAKADV